MALLRVDSFDHYNTAFAPKKGWSFELAGASPGATGASIGAYGRNSSNGLRCKSTGGAGNVGRSTLPISGVTSTTAGLGFAYKCESSLPDTTVIVCQIQNASSPQISLTLTTGGALQIRRGNTSGTIIETSVTTLSPSVWYFLELKVLFHDSTGTYELKIDGVSEMSDTGVDTISSGSAGWDSIVLGAENVNTTYNASYDDLHVYDGATGSNNTFLGDHRIVCVVASSGNGTATDWTCSTGSDHGALVDENPANDTDYNQAGTAGLRDTYNFAAVGVSGTVKALQTVNLIKADVAGVRYVGDVARISSTNYDGTGTTVGSDWVFRCEVHPTSPATSTAWTTSEIDGAEFGVKVTA